MTRTAQTRHWPAYASAAWLVSFLGWHIPMLWGWQPLPDDTGAPEPHPAVSAVFTVAVLFMAVAGTAVVLATVRPWGRRVPRWLLLAPLVFGSVLLVVRGVPGFVEFVLQVTGVAPAGVLGLLDPSLEAPTGADLWIGYAINLDFFLGAVLLVPATYRFARRWEPMADAGDDRSLCDV